MEKTNIYIIYEHNYKIELYKHILIVKTTLREPNISDVEEIYFISQRRPFQGYNQGCYSPGMSNHYAPYNFISLNPYWNNKQNLWNQTQP